MAFLPWVPNFLVVLIVFGIPFVLVGIMAFVFGASLISWFRESTARVRRHFVCKIRNMPVEVDFRPQVFSEEFRDVERCSAFGDDPVTCDKDCLHW